MKKILIIAVIIFGLLLAALAVFVITFDADRYRPLLKQQLESALNLPVDIEKIGLAWSDGLALDLRGLRVYSAKDKSQLLLDVQRANANVEISPLMHGQVVVSSLVIKKPEVHLVKTQSGALKGFEKPSTGTASPAIEAEKQSSGSAAAGGAAFMLSFDMIGIQDAVVTYRDEGEGMTQPISIDDIDITLRDVSWHESVKIDGKASLFSSRQNIDFGGSLQYLIPQQTLSLKGINAAVSLDKMEREELARSLSFIEDLSLPEKIGGEINVEAQEIKVVRGMPDYEVKAVYSGGFFRPEDFPSAVRDIEASALFTPQRIEVQSVSFNLAEGKGAFSGVIDMKPAFPRSEARFSLVGLDLGQILVNHRQGEPYPSGRVTASFQGGASGLQEAAIQNSLTGSGQLMLNDGVIHNLNVVKEVLNALSIVPGLAQRLESRLTEEYKEKINTPDTRLNPVQIPFSVQGAGWSAPQVNIASDTFSLAGSASGSWAQGTYQSQFVISLDPDLSLALIQSVEELRFISSPEGRIEIPVTVRGAPGSVQFQPNVQTLAGRLAVGKTQQVLGSFFERKNEKAAPVTEASADTNSQSPRSSAGRAPSDAKSPAPAELLLGQLLNEVLGDSSGEEASPQNRP